MRTRSPRMAPPLSGLDGSTASAATRMSRARKVRITALIRVDLPEPGGPVRPMTGVSRRSFSSACNSLRASSPPISARGERPGQRTGFARAQAVGESRGIGPGRTGPFRGGPRVHQPGIPSGPTASTSAPWCTRSTAASMSGAI